MVGRRLWSVLTSAVLAAGVIVGIGGMGAESASAASSSDFDPGFLISDENFYNGSAMGMAEVQSFILSQNSSCTSSYACLWNYRQNTPTMPATTYCRAMPGMGAEPASSIIARVGAACGISQRALLVILQKEQSLVSSSAPSQRSFEAATGFGCPDTSPCDSSYGGFFYQVYNAARQFQVYRQFPTSFNHQPRAVNNILFNPNRGCGTSSVFILNDATAGLYNYTPYQPNAAALGNLYGTGDGCSAYGNRNFWRLWTDWFGSPTDTGVNLVRDVSTGWVYVVSGGMRYPVTSGEVLAQYRAIGSVVDRTPADLAAYRVGTEVQRTARTTDGTVYLIDGGRRFRFAGCWQVQDFGQPCDGQPTMTKSQLGRLADGGSLTSLVRTSDGTTWLMQAGHLREAPDPQVLVPYGITQPALSLSDYTIGWAPIGAPVIAPGFYGNGLGDLRMATAAGIYEVPPAAAPMLSGVARTLRTASFDNLAAGAVMPLRAISDGKAFILVQDGWLQVSPAEYGGAERFTTLPAGAISAPIVGVRTTPHFIRERSSAQVFLISGGYRQAVRDQAEQSWISTTYGVENRVWVTPDGGLSGVIQAVPGVEAVRAPDGTAYLLDAGRRYRFTGCVQVGDFGQSCSGLRAISWTELDRYQDGGALTSLVRSGDGTIWFMQGGSRRETPDPAVLAPYGVSARVTALSDSVITSAQVGPPVLAAGVVTDDRGRVRAATPGGNFDLSPAAVAAIGSSARRIQAASMDQIPSSGALPLRMTSGGRSYVLVSGGWLEVSAATYGGATFFTTAPAGSVGAAPVLATRSLPHFVRAASSGTVYLVSGGYLRAVRDEAEQAWISQAYGVENRVWVVADGALDGLVNWQDLTQLQLVRTPSGAPFLLDGGRAIPFADCAQASVFGLDCTTFPTVADSQLDGLTRAAQLRSLVEGPDGVDWLIQSGSRREVPDASVLTAFGLPTEPTRLEAYSVAGLPVGMPVLRPGLYTDGDSVRVVAANGRYDLAPASLALNATAATTLTPESFTQLTSSGVLPLRVSGDGRLLISVSGGWLVVTARAFGTADRFTPVPAGVVGALPIAGNASGAIFAREQSSQTVYLVSDGTAQPVPDQATLSWISAAYGVPSTVWVTADGTLAGLPGAGA